MNYFRKKRVHNAGNPNGFWGVRTLNAMNKEHKNLTDRGLSLLEIRDNAVCLDIGCGGGRTLSKLSIFAKNGKIYGIDISETSVERSKKYNKKDVKSGKMTIINGSVNSLPFEDEKFDVITAVETFYFWEDKGECVKEVYRTLKKGGSFAVMLDAYEDGTDDMKEVVEEIDLQLNTLGELRGFFENAGFETELFTQGKTVIVIGKKSA